MPHYNSINELLANDLLWYSKEEGPLQQVVKSQKALNNFNKDTIDAIPLGIEEIDQVLPNRGLLLGKLHEWSLENIFSSQAKHYWHPPLFIISSIVDQAWRYISSKDNRKHIAWIGKKCWPSPHILKTTSTRNSSAQHLFVDPPDKNTRLWAITQALKNRSIAAVVADGSALTTAASRRLQLATESSCALCILARPPWELSLPSVAQSRWRVSPFEGSKSFSWQIELLRLKGASLSPQQETGNIQTKWILNYAGNLNYTNDKTNSLFGIYNEEATDKTLLRAIA